MLRTSSTSADLHDPEHQRHQHDQHQHEVDDGGAALSAPGRGQRRHYCTLLSALLSIPSGSSLATP